MKKAMLRWIGGMTEPQRLRREVQEGKSPEVRLRRAIAGSSLLGMAGMAAVPCTTWGLFYQMPHVEKAWCSYCITDALSHLVTFGLTISEAKRAMRKLVSRRRVSQ